jgi:hypothetical protein
MIRVLIQARRDGEWLKVSSLTYDKSRDATKQVGDRFYYSRRDAIRQAHHMLQNWNDSDQYIGVPMRIVEEISTGFGTHFRPIARMGG